MSRTPRTECHPALSDIGAALASGCADPDGLECRRVLVAGAEIFFQVLRSEAASHRPPVVLVHGYGMSSRYMMPLALELARDFAVYAPDLPGFGRSSKPRKVLDMVELADALAAWMARIGLRRAVMIGNSMGCQVLVELAVRHQDRVDRLVLQGLTPDPAARTVRQQVWRQLVNSRHDVSWAIMRIGLRDYAAAGPRRLLLTLRHILRHRVEDQLPLITMPTLVVRGTRDAVMPHEWAHKAASLLPRGRLVEVASGAHIMHFHAPDRLARMLRRFLELSPDRVPSSEPDMGRTFTTPGDGLHSRWGGRDELHGP
jgi:2-hydroxy-6-oxonona-2,4-dienedioate hydrolase